MHYAGYAEQVKRVGDYDRWQCIELIENLYGWPASDIEPEKVYDADAVPLEELRAEALAQLEWEWTVPTKHLNLYPDAEE